MAHAMCCCCLCHRCCLCLQVDRAKVLSNTIKQKRKEKAGKWEVPLPKVSSFRTRICTVHHKAST